MKHLKIFLLTLLFTGLILQAQEKPGQTDTVLKHIKYLSSNKLQGRYPGTEGDRLAAAYIRERFVSNGLNLMFGNGFQSFDVVTGVKLLEGNVFETEDFETTLEKDFVPLSFSANASATGTVFFAGYGMIVPNRWDDYAGVDVTGKWVLAFTADPEPENQQSEFIPFSSDRVKAINARDRGAAGLLLVKGVSTDKEDKLMPAYYDKTAMTAGIPVINITRKLANHLISGRGFKIEDLEKELQASMARFSFEAFTQVNATVAIEYIRVNTQNVVAELTGNHPELKHEYIVVGAHYDHLGMGGTGSGSRQPDTSAVHSGADDNASGVAALLEVASRFAAGYSDLSRSVLFVAFGAEEMGLVGSKYFMEHAPVPANQIKTMINLDMIGRMKEEAVLTVGGTGTAAEFNAMLDQFEAGRSFTLNRQPDGYGPSDHAAFYSASIPVLFITTGAHEDYHTPADTWDKINTEALSAITDFVFDIGLQLANLEESLTFTESGSMTRQGRGRGYKVSLGIIPDVASTRQGLGVDGVRKDGPASRAGIRKGDIIIGMNGMTVGNIYEYMARLNSLAAGETVIVEVMRDGKKEVLLVQL